MQIWAGNWQGLEETAQTDHILRKDRIPGKRNSLINQETNTSNVWTFTQNLGN